MTTPRVPEVFLRWNAHDSHKLAPFGRSRTARSTAATILVIAACTVPTGSMCGCPPLRGHIYVAGRLLSESGASVAGARVFASPVRATHAPLPSPHFSFEQSVLVGTNGVFGFRAFSANASGAARVQLAVVVAGSVDTLHFAPVGGTLRSEFQAPDTARIELSVP